jgi:hypothetical protein
MLVMLALLLLPLLQLPPLRQPPPAVGPPGGWDPLEELSLNCSDPAQAGRCQAAAEANTYESNMDYVSAAELQEYIKVGGAGGRRFQGFCFGCVNVTMVQRLGKGSQVHGVLGAAGA